MSFILQKSELEKEHKEFIRKECNITEKATLYNKHPNTFKVFTVRNDKVVLPFALWKELCEEFPNDHNYKKFNIKFEGDPLEKSDRDQKTVLALAKEKLAKDHFVFLALRTGFGKTFCALNLICQLGLKTVILCHNTVLHKQWKDEAAKYCPELKVEIVKNDKLEFNAHVHIMGVRKCTHYDEKIFSRVGVVVVDEAHLTYTSTFTDALLQFEPKYLIGLSATPDRLDGKHALLPPFFGSAKDFIVRKQVKTMTVIKYKTTFKPDVRYMFGGTLDWNAIINSLSYNEERHKTISQLVEDFYEGKIHGTKDDNKDKKVLILCKRVETVEKLSKLIKFTTDYVSASKKSMNNDAQVLIGTFGKLSVGFDSDRDVLILESDVKDVRQSEGRIRKDNNLIIDIVDDFGILEKHWKDRAKWYLERGAEIKLIKM